MCSLPSGRLPLCVASFALASFSSRVDACSTAKRQPRVLRAHSANGHSAPTEPQVAKPACAACGHCC